MDIKIAHPRSYAAEAPLNLTYVGKDEDKRDVYVVSHSQLTDFMNCEERHRLGYYQGWMLRAPVTALNFGSLFHQALELGFQGKSPKQVHMMINKEAREIAKTMPDAASTQQFRLDVCKILAMVPAYFKRYKEDVTRTDWDRRPEVEFDEPILETKDYVVRLRGKIDLLIAEKKPLKEVPTYYVMEHKTASRPDESYFARLRLDWQVYAYIWACKKLTGKYPKSVIYDVVKKTQIRRKVKETEEEFMERVRLEYTDFADDKNYFMRYTILPDKTQYQTWLKQIRQVCSRLVRKLRSEKPVWIMNTDQCVHKYGKCKFFSVCMSGGNISDMIYKLKEPSALKPEEVEK
jgi:hypothetical protein